MQVQVQGRARERERGDYGIGVAVVQGIWSCGLLFFLFFVFLGSGGISLFNWSRHAFWSFLGVLTRGFLHGWRLSREGFLALWYILAARCRDFVCGIGVS